MFERNHLLKSIQSSLDGLNVVDFLNREFDKIIDDFENSYLSKEQGTEVKCYYANAKPRNDDYHYLLIISHLPKLFKVTSDKSLSVIEQENNLRIHKNHFYFDITIASKTNKGLEGSNLVQFNYSKRKKGQIVENPVGYDIIILDDFQSGLKPVIIEELIIGAIRTFCKNMNVQNCEFHINMYRYNSDSTDAAVYYTTFNCMAELFNLKEKGTFVLSHDDLKLDEK